ncbi:MAG: SDR family NAD(P)-dependent oxidoreductase, partial [Micropepsaceae bacterium]
CDDEPAPPHEVVEFAAKLLGVPPPRLERYEDAAPTMSEMAQSFYAESKRVRNDRIKTELSVKLLYPTYREGLRALL